MLGSNQSQSACGVHFFATLGLLTRFNIGQGKCCRRGPISTRARASRNASTKFNFCAVLALTPIKSGCRGSGRCRHGSTCNRDSRNLNDHSVRSKGVESNINRVSAAIVVVHYGCEVLRHWGSAGTHATDADANWQSEEERKRFEFFLKNKFCERGKARTFWGVRETGSYFGEQGSYFGEQGRFFGERCADRESVRPANDFSAPDGEAAEEVRKWSMPKR